MNLQKWLDSGKYIQDVEGEMSLCTAADMYDDPNCNWHDMNGDWWLVEVLSDGTAITWCLES